MELRKSHRMGARAASRWSKWMMLVAIAPVLIVHRLAFSFDAVFFPAIRRREVCRPLFIVGLPRSGTTFLHRLIGQQAQFTTFPLWELIFAPALCEKYLIYWLYRMDRYLGSPCRKILVWLMAKLGGENETHATSLLDAEEDFLGLLPFDGCFLRVLVWPFSEYSWRLAFMDDRASDRLQARLLARYRGLLVRHLCFRGEGLTLVSKNPSFSAWVEGLAAEFPDAKFIALRRPPCECVPSQLSAIRNGLQFFGHRSDDPFIVKRFVELLAHYWSRLKEADGILESSRFRLVEYRQLTADPYGVVVSSLDRFGYSLSDEGRELLLQMSEQGRQYRSRHRYSLAEFGLTQAHIDSAFGDNQVSSICSGISGSANNASGTKTLTSDGYAGIP